MSTRIHQKRVILNRRSSSLILDSQAMIKRSSTMNSMTATPLVEAIFEKEASVVSSRLQNILLSSSMLKPSLRSVNSAPCTPKSVHFDQNNLENICLFRKAQTPSSIQQRGVFWADEDDSSSEDENSDKEEQEEIVRELICTNWPNRLADILNKKNKIIRVEKSHFRLTENTMIGKVLVKNLDYHKTVMIRYTFDFWETYKNVQASFCQHHKIYDVFSFHVNGIPKTCSTIYFAICYRVGDNQEYWDNNNGRNYEIHIVNKKKKIQKQQEEEKELCTRYDFGQSIYQAKNTPTTLAMPIPRRRSVPSREHAYLSSSPTCHSPLSSSPSSLVELNSQSYRDLVNKYCFYSTSPTRSPMSING
ncbi:carbohydrate-binding module family 21 protein [Backusella circina FSU 941]|nr:carbohydrate-binding module family 21 protein [Backusella circina FSU 941]